jgi:hypothetical protein
MWSKRAIRANLLSWSLTGTGKGVFILSAIALLFPAGRLAAQETKTRDQLVREDFSNFGAVDTWIYNDLDKGFETARQTGKPLLVVFRCIPCHACAQLDQSIVERDLRVQALLDQYVCVRVVQANGLDLGLFQFDYDQSFAAFLMNGDKTVYGRYGTRSHQTESDDDVTLEGFAQALEAGLAIHASYPVNKSGLAGKQPRSQPRYGTPEQYPRLSEYASELDYEGKVAASCIHCHQVGESLHAVLRDAGEPIPEERLFPYPHPKILGLVMDPNQCATVEAVKPGSLAERAGIRSGDELVALNGQPLVSIADIQWVLHNANQHDSLVVALRRNGEPKELKLSLEPGWRSRGDISWRATSWALRRMTTGGLLLEDLPDAQRKARGLADDELALIVKHVGEYGDHAHAKRQGFLKDDVLVSVAGNTERMRESDLFALLVNKPVGERVSITVRRGEELKKLSLTMQK